MRKDLVLQQLLLKRVIVFLYVFAFIMLIMPFFIYSQESAPDVTIPQIFESIAALIKDWKNLQAVGVVSAIMMIVVQILKYLIKEFLNDPGKEVMANWARVLITLLGVVVAILSKVMTGVPWIDACIFALITSGGAISLYQVLKPVLFKSKEPSLK